MKYLILSLSLLSLLACSNSRVAPIDRTVTPELEKVRFEKPKWQQINDNFLETNFDACETLKRSNQLFQVNPYQRSYQFVEKLFLSDTDEPEWLAKVKVSRSPFVQMYMGESLQIPNREEFYKEAKALYEAGKLSKLKWLAVKAAYKTGIGYDSIRYSAVNDKIEEGFSGVFGDAAPFDSSLFSALAKKSLAFPPMQLSQSYSQKLRLRTPLFDSYNWEEFATNVHNSNAAALLAFYGDSKNQDPIKRQCALVLLQKTFAQLLALKGYTGVSLKKGYLPELDADELPDFRKKRVGGAFLSPNKKRLVLQAEQISNYSPSSQYFALASSTPGNRRSPKPANFSEHVSFLKAMLGFYRATSPAEKWVSDSENYLLGNITERNTKILPLEAHSLSLGLLGMTFKNLAHSHLVKVNEKGQRLKEGESAAGLLVGDINGDEIELKLNDILELAKLSVYLNRSLDRFLTKSPEAWNSYHPFYNLNSLSTLLGSKINPNIPASNDPSLRGQLQSLQFPLAALILKMYKGVCVSSANINLVTGEISPLSLCDDDTQKNAKTSLNLMAVHNDAPILWQGN